MFDGNRWAWNLLLEKIGTRLFDKSIKESVLKEEIRPFVQKANISKDLSISVLNEQCFDSAFRDIFKSKKAIWEATKAKKLRDGQGFILPERLRNKTKKDSGNSIEIRSRDFTYFKKQRVIKFFPEYFNFDRKSKQGIKIKTNLRKIGVSIDHSCRLVMTDDLFFLHIPYEKKCVPTQSTATCALDPGVRTFLTGYNPEGGTFEISNQNKHIYDRQALINKLQKKLQTESSKRKRKDFRRHITDLYRKVKNCIGDMHHKVSKMLSENFSCIILPEFSTSKMVKKKTNEKWRKINGTTAHRMLTFAHYKFRQLLKQKVEQRRGKLIICTEEYTSMTCGQCGRLNRSLGASKTFICPYNDCKMIADRDINAARNIYIKNHSSIR